MDTLLNRYTKALEEIGFLTLLCLPDETKELLQKTTNLDSKVVLMEEIRDSLKRQGLTRR